MKHTPRYIEKCRRTERRGHGGDDDGGGAGRERYEFLQKVKDKERLLEGASHVSFERQRQGRKKVVSKSIDAFKEMEPKIFFDQAVFPSLEFKLT